MKTKKLIKNLISTTLILAWFILPAGSSLAQVSDVPAGYIGSGYRSYLDGKIQYGYYVDKFVNITRRQEERVLKRKQIEEVLNYSLNAANQSNYAISTDKSNLKYHADKLNMEILTDIQKGKENAAAQGEFNYVKHTDGRTDYFTDGLTTTIINERVLDEFGNISLKNSNNMKYNDDRLLVNYNTTIKDNLGNISRQYWEGEYTADSVFYGTDTTNANKHFSTYTMIEFDPAGNKKVSEWEAVNYDGKLLRAFSQHIEDEIYGTLSFTRSDITYTNNDPKQPFSYHEEGYGTNNLFYCTERTETGYNDKDQVTNYHEETLTTLIDGTQSKTTVDAEISYKFVDHVYKDLEADPDRLAGTHITSVIENPDGSIRTETTTTDYTYDNNNSLIAACGESEFNGQQAKWFEFKDKEGHIVTRKDDENGNITYSYIDEDTLEEVFVLAEDVTTTLKDGNYYSGTSEIGYEILFGKPMTTSAHSEVSYTNSDDGYLFKTEEMNINYTNGLVNNMRRQLYQNESTSIKYPYLDPDSTHVETQNIFTTYIYDSLGNLKDAEGKGTAQGYEFRTERGDWVFPYTSDIVVDYVVILGRPLQEAFHEYKHYEPIDPVYGHIDLE